MTFPSDHGPSAHRESQSDARRASVRPPRDPAGPKSSRSSPPSQSKIHARAPSESHPAEGAGRTDRERTAPGLGGPGRSLPAKPKRSTPPPPQPPPSRQLFASRRTLGNEAAPDFEGPADILLRVSVHAGGESLTYIHEFVGHYAKERYRGSVAESVDLAAFELLGNGISYGSVSSPVILEIAEQKPWVLIRVSNDAIGARTRRLLEQVARLTRDAQGTYVDQVQRSVASAGGRALLGLARVAHEGGMKIDARVTGDRVLVTAYRRA